jgi:hypothetical protein
VAKKLIILICLLLLCLFLSANLAPLSTARGSAEEEAGYALLDSLVTTFKEMADKREKIFEKTDKELEELMQEAERAKWQNQIDDAFFKRYTRILVALKLVIMPVDKGSPIMKALIFRELNQFIEDIEGEKFDLEKATSGKEAINKFALAVTHELVNLRIYLDNKGKAKKLAEEYRKEIGIDEEAIEMPEQKERQLKSMKAIEHINLAISDYVTDHGAPPEQAGIYDKHGSFYKALSPFYVKTLHVKDTWGTNLQVYSGKACNGVYGGIKGCTEKDVIIVSFGRDGKKENWKYDSKNPEAGIYELKSLDAFDLDLVMLNGKWIRAPKDRK